jgi:general secretion pathway protein K
MKPGSCNNWRFNRRCPAPLTKIRHREQAGVALITVLLIVFLASTAAVSLASVQQLTIRRSTLLLHREQARLYALGAEQWAVAVLKRDQQSNQDNVDDLSEPWANLPPSLPIEGGKISARIEDLQGRFNLNNLIKSASQLSSSKRAKPSDDPGRDEDSEEEPKDENGQGNKDTPKAVNKDDKKVNKDGDKTPGNIPAEGEKTVIDKEQLPILKKLLEVLELPTEIADTIVDWIDPDQEPTFPDGAEDSEYTVSTPPYLAANRPFTSVSELRLIKGIDKAAYAKLAPHVCVLPHGTRINVNTLTASLLRALTGIDSMAAEALIEDLKQQGFKNTDDFLRALGLVTNDPALPKKILAVQSRYFTLQIEAQVGEGRATLYSILERSTDGGTRVLTHSFGNQL